MRRLRSCKSGLRLSEGSRLASAACGTGFSFSSSRSKKSERAAEQDRPDVAKARDEWRVSQPDLNPERLVFIDETGAATDAPLWPLSARATPGLQRALGILEDDHICRRAPHQWNSSALRIRRPNGWTELSRLCRAVRGSHPAIRRYRHHGQSAQPQGRWHSDSD